MPSEAGQTYVVTAFIADHPEPGFCKLCPTALARNINCHNFKILKD